MSKKNRKAEKIKKNKMDGRTLATRIMAFILVVLMLIAACSTFIYYLVALNS